MKFVDDDDDDDDDDDWKFTIHLNILSFSQNEILKYGTSCRNFGSQNGH